MHYFRQMLLTYSTDREISNLLHIHVETEKPKVLIPPSKSKIYVDQILNEYSVKMYNYPELNSLDAKLAYNIFSQKKAGINVFQFDQVKRKPLKKKVSKKIVVTPPISQAATQVRSCPCCGTKVVNKHKCEHTYCQKPCSRVKRRQPLAISPQHTPQALIKKKKVTDEEDFTPQKDQLDNQQSKYSNSENQSYYQEDQQITPQDESSQEFPSNITKTKKVQKKKKGKRRGKTQPNRVRTFPTKKIQSRRPSKKQSKPSQDQNQNQQNKIQENVIKPQVEQQQNIQPPQITRKQSQIHNIENSTNKKTKPIRKRNSKKKPNQSSSQIQSQYQVHSSPRKQLKRKRTHNSKVDSGGVEEKQSEIQQKQLSKVKRYTHLSTFCEPEDLKRNLRFSVRIIDDNQGQLQQQQGKQQKKQQQKQHQNQFKTADKNIASSKNLQKQVEYKEEEELRIELAGQQNRNQQKNRNQQLEAEQTNNNNLAQQGQYQEQPIVNAVLDQVSESFQEYDELFKNEANE